jgi:hypothetical protein
MKSDLAYFRLNYDADRGLCIACNILRMLADISVVICELVGDLLMKDFIYLKHVKGMYNFSVLIKTVYLIILSCKLLQFDLLRNI